MRYFFIFGLFFMAVMLSAGESPDGTFVLREIDEGNVPLVSALLRENEVSFKLGGDDQIIVSRPDYAKCKWALYEWRLLKAETVGDITGNVVRSPVLLDLILPQYVDDTAKLLTDWRIPFLRRGNDFVIDERNFHKVYLKLNSLFWLERGYCVIKYNSDGFRDPAKTIGEAFCTSADTGYLAFANYWVDHIKGKEINEERLNQQILRVTGLYQVDFAFLAPDQMIVKAVYPVPHVWMQGEKEEIKQYCRGFFARYSEAPGNVLQYDFR